METNIIKYTDKHKKKCNETTDVDRQIGIDR